MVNKDGTAFVEKKTEKPQERDASHTPDSKWDEFRDALFGPSSDANNLDHHAYHSSSTTHANQEEYPHLDQPRPSQHQPHSSWNKDSFLHHNNTSSPLSSLYSNLDRDKQPLYKSPWKRNNPTNHTQHPSSNHTSDSTSASNLHAPSVSTSTHPKTPRAHHTASDALTSQQPSHSADMPRTRRREESESPQSTLHSSGHNSHHDSGNTYSTDSPSRHWIKKPSKASTSKRPINSPKHVFSRKDRKQVSGRNTRHHHGMSPETTEKFSFPNNDDHISEEEEEHVEREVDVPGFSRKLRTDANGSVIVKRSESMWQTLRQEWGVARPSSTLAPGKKQAPIFQDSSSSDDEESAFITSSGRRIQRDANGSIVVKRSDSMWNTIRKELSDENGVTPTSTTPPRSSLTTTNSLQPKANSSRASSPTDVLRRKVKERISSQLHHPAHPAVMPQQHGIHDANPQQSSFPADVNTLHDDSPSSEDPSHRKSRKRSETVTEFLQRLNQRGASQINNTHRVRRPFTRFQTRAQDADSAAAGGQMSSEESPGEPSPSHSKHDDSKPSWTHNSDCNDKTTVQDSSDDDNDSFSNRNHSPIVSYHQNGKSVEKTIRDLQEEASNLRRKNKLLEIRESRASTKLKETETLLKQERQKVKQLSHDIEQLKRDIITLENENKAMGIHNQSLNYKNSAFIEYQMKSDLYGREMDSSHRGQRVTFAENTTKNLDEKQSIAMDETPEGKRAKRRVHCLKEILSTETYYVEALNILKDYFMIPMREQRLLSEDALRHIFDPVPTIISINSDFLEQMEVIYEKYLDSDQRELTKSLCRLVISFEHRLKGYDKYICNYKIATSTLKRNMHSKLEQFLLGTTDILAQKKLRTTNIDAYLVQPIQRIPRYRMLLQELSKYVDPNDEETNQLMTTAINSSNTVATYCNAKQQEADIRDETMTVLTELDLLDEYSPSETRVLIQISTPVACEVAGKKFPGKVFLFDGFLVVHSLKKKKQTVVISFNDPSLVVHDKQERQVRYIFTEENGKESSLVLKFKVQDVSVIQKLNGLVREQIEKHGDDLRLVRSSMRNIDGLTSPRGLPASRAAQAPRDDMDDDGSSTDSNDDGLDYQALLSTASPNPFFIYQMAQQNQMRSMQQW